MRKVVILVLCILLNAAENRAETNKKNDKENELRRLEDVMREAKSRVRGAWRIKPSDFLQLLPTVTIARRAPTSEMPTTENYISISISTHQIWNISERYDRRDALRAKALRQINTSGFIIKKYIERKHLYRERLWKLTQIRKSMENPVEIATLDEKIDDLKIRIQEIEIMVEKAYAEMANACVDVEK